MELPYLNKNELINLSPSFPPASLPPSPSLSSLPPSLPPSLQAYLPASFSLSPLPPSLACHSLSNFGLFLHGLFSSFLSAVY